MARTPTSPPPSESQAGAPPIPPSPPKPLPDRFATGHDFLVASGAVDERLFGAIVREVTSKKTEDKIVLFLTTYGGLANAAYRIGSFLPSIYDEVTLVATSLCKSAGTLVACAAKSLVVFPFGELGPLDVQLLKRDELFERRSGLITNYALKELQQHTFNLFEHFMLSIKARGDSISFKMASEIAAKIASDIMEDVYAHINVDAIGEDARNLAVASEYCTRLNKRYGNLKEGSITRLVHGYPSHDFVIDYQEALTLFQRVERSTDTLFKILAAYGTDLISPRSPSVVQMVTVPSPDASSISPASGTPREAK